MPTISNDHDLRDALNGLSADQQRIIGAGFTKSVIHLCRDERVRRAVQTAQNPDASDAELQDALKMAKGYAAKTYTACGKDTDWLAQADHFVAAAAAAALTPVGQLATRTNPAWKAAVQARMAKNCELMEEEEGEMETEADRQYRIADESF
ncbi:MAG: hypothetical protein LJE70_11650 [Chromatiaceae bacterium]|nr:hypothetical protein [Chromatiaceae bacterium]